MKAVIIEDENWAAKELQRKILNVAKDVDVVAHLPSLKTARKWFMENAEPDVLFMDIQLSDGVSFELFDYYKLSCPVIFTTAYDEYAVRAFRVNGVDYLLKPVDEDDLQRAIEKCRRLTETRMQLPVDMIQLVQAFKNNGSASSFKERFLVNVRNQWLPLYTRDIAYFIKDSYHYLYTLAGDKHMIDHESLDEIEELLDPKSFYRANRQFIINIEAIQSVKPQENQKLTVLLKHPANALIDISREKAPAFRKWLER